MKGERPDAEGGQFNGVQQGHLDHSVGVRAPAWPVLVTLYLQDRSDGSVLGQTLHWWGSSFPNCSATGEAGQVAKARGSARSVFAENQDRDRPTRKSFY